MENVLTTVEEVSGFFSKANRELPLFVDTETNGLDTWRGHRLCGVSMFQNDVGVFVPFRMQDSGDNLDLFYKTMNAESGVLDQISRNVPQHVSSAFNAKFDTKIFRADGIDVNIVADPYVAASLVLAGKKTAEGRKQRLKLKTIARDFLSIDVSDSERLDQWFDAHGMKNDEDKRFDLVPIELLAPYAIADVRILAAVHAWCEREVEKWELKKQYELEMSVMKVLTEMEWEGVFIDVEHCARHKESLDADIKKLCAGLKFDPAKDDEVIKELQQAGIQLTTHTEKGGVAVDKNILEKIDHPIAKSVLEFRRLRSPYNFFNQLLDRCDEKGFVHPSFQQFSSDQTPGRTSCTSPNLQNQPRDPKWGVRHSFIPPKGMRLCFGDYSQMHLRIAANIADEPAMQDAFLNGIDIHSHTASLIYGVPVNDVDKVQRRRAKDANFCFLYAGGLAKFAQTAGISEDDARPIYYGLHKAYPKAKSKQEELQKDAEKVGYTRSPTGRIRFLDEFRKAFNTAILGVEADVSKGALVEIDRAARELGGRAVNMVHDEIQFYVPEEVPDEKVIEIVKSTEDYSGKVPLIIDASVADPSWGSKRDLKPNLTKTTVDLGGVKNMLDISKPNEWSLKDLENESAIVKIKLKDGSFVYLAGTEAVKSRYNDGKRVIYLVSEVAEMVTGIQKLEKK